MRHGLSEDDVQGLAASMHGFVGADVAALCQEAALFALRRVVKAKSCSTAGSEDAQKEGGCGHAMEVHDTMQASC